jgi:hypothetical protein
MSETGEFPRAPRDDDEREACDRDRRSELCLSEADGWMCSRNKRHAGDHIAGLLSGEEKPICHRWPVAAPPSVPSAPRHDAGTGDHPAPTEATAERMEDAWGRTAEEAAALYKQDRADLAFWIRRGDMNKAREVLAAIDARTGKGE